MLAEFAGIRTWLGSQGRREVGRRPSAAAGSAAGVVWLCSGAGPGHEASEGPGAKPRRAARGPQHVQPPGSLPRCGVHDGGRRAQHPGGGRGPPAPRTPRAAVSGGLAGPCARGSAAERGHGAFCDGTHGRCRCFGTPPRVPRAQAAGTVRVRSGAGAQAGGRREARASAGPHRLFGPLCHHVCPHSGAT